MARRAFQRLPRRPNEYRSILRHLLHLATTIDYNSTTITVTLDRPDSSHVARSVRLLTDELSAPGSLPGEHRPLTYQLAAPQFQQTRRT